MNLLDAVNSDDFEGVKSVLYGDTCFSQEELSKALTQSVGCQDLRIVSLLIQRGADINLVLEDVTPPLLTAVIYDRPHVIALLIENGAEINLQDSVGNTALQLALEDEILEAEETSDVPKMNLSRLLIESGADPTIVDGTGNTAIDDARKAGYKEAVELFLDSLTDQENTQG
ncbi:MAG: hypothetical protein CME32_17010 [Gimesia sp.]|nr:hypothetical protein [Gimesia sp.]